MIKQKWKIIQQKNQFFEDLTTSDQKHDPKRERKDILYMTQVKRSTWNDFLWSLLSKVGTVVQLKVNGKTLK